MGEGKKVSIVIYDPQRKVLYKKKDASKGIILFETTTPGEYSIVLSNFGSGKDVVVTLVLHTYEELEKQTEYDLTDAGELVSRNQDDAAKGDTWDEWNKRSEEDMAADDEDIGEVKEMLRAISVEMRQIHAEAKLSMIRQTSHNDDLLESASRNFYVALIELLAFVLVIAFQTHHMKKTLDNKLIL